MSTPKDDADAVKAAYNLMLLRVDFPVFFNQLRQHGIDATDPHCVELLRRIGRKFNLKKHMKAALRAVDLASSGPPKSDPEQDRARKLWSTEQANDLDVAAAMLMLFRATNPKIVEKSEQGQASDTPPTTPTLRPPSLDDTHSTPH